MEYNPNLFTSYETTTSSTIEASDANLLKQCGKFEKSEMKAGRHDHKAPLTIFVMASVLEARNKNLLSETKGLDDVVKVSLPPFFNP